MIIKGNWETREVTIDGHRLDPRPSQKVWNHSPDGFNWGYHGSGPAQLALAILLRSTKQDVAVQLHQAFKREFVSRLPQSDFEVDFDVESWINWKMAIFLEDMLPAF
jgi:hypothetical protein